jgi:hypothetical protein
MTAQQYLDRASYVESLKNNNLIAYLATAIDSANFDIELKFPTGNNVNDLMISLYRNSQIEKQYVDLTGTLTNG